MANLFQGFQYPLCLLQILTIDGAAINLAGTDHLFRLFKIFAYCFSIILKHLLLGKLQADFS